MSQLAAGDLVLKDKVTHEPLFTAETVVPCGHNFNASTITEIMRKAFNKRLKPMCPICRTAIRSTVVNHDIRALVKILVDKKQFFSSNESLSSKMASSGNSFQQKFTKQETLPTKTVILEKSLTHERSGEVQEEEAHRRYEEDLKAVDDYIAGCCSEMHTFSEPQKIATVQLIPCGHFLKGESCELIRSRFRLRPLCPACRTVVDSVVEVDKKILKQNKTTLRALIVEYQCSIEGKFRRQR